MPPLAPEDQELIARERAMCAAVRALDPSSPVPYFAHLQLDTDRGERDLLLGPATRVGEQVAVVDWQTAPLAAVFFVADEGEEYEIAEGRRLLTGTVRRKALVTFARGRLAEIVTAERRLVRAPEGRWTRAATPPTLLAPRDAAARARPASPVEVPLDDQQRAAVERPAGQPVLVLGEAGAGKTTVALHRLAHLADSAAGEAGEPRIAAVVPTEGLRRLTAALLDRLGLPEVPVRLFDHWAAEQARRVYRGLPRQLAEDATAGVIRFKRHPALRAALAELARVRPGPRDAPRGARVRRADLLHLFGDRDLLDRAAAASAGALTETLIDEVLEHTRVQFSRTTEQEYAHIDPERLKTLDGRAIDAGTPMNDAGSLDAEDHAVLFALDRAKAAVHGRRPAGPSRHDILLLDEAQELAPLELELLGRALSARRGTLIVAGDAAQQIDPSAYFRGWTESLAELGIPRAEVITLTTSYRCPPAVTALARWVRDGPPRGAAATGGRSPATDVAAPRTMEGAGGGEITTRPGDDPAVGAALVRQSFASECHLVARLTGTLRDLVVRDPRAITALICHDRATARRLARLLGRGVELRLALDGDFDFGAGVQVTTVAEVKGLEFDHVIVPDAEAIAYPDEPRSRRALYVAATRAVHRLTLLAVGTWSPLLPPR